MMLGILSKKSKESVAARVVARLEELGLPGLPRNYETIYMLETSAPIEMTQAFERVTAKGKPKQADIDEIHRQFIRPSAISLAVHERLLGEVRDVVDMLKEDQTTRRQYSEVLVTAANGITTGINESVLKKLIGVIQNANEVEIARGKTTATKIQSKSKDLEEVQRELERFKSMAHEDALTGISNRRVFDVALRNIYSRPCDRSRIGLILTDIDHFKKFNDKYGHAIGDQVLKVVAEVLKNNVDSESIVCRTGGEEFAIIIHDVNATQTIAISERLRQAIGKSEIVSKDNGSNFGSVSMSFGVCMASLGEGPEDFYKKADAALYKSKNDGRDRVTLHVPGVTQERRKAS